MKEILMWSNDDFRQPYIVTAKSRMEAAEIVARHIRKDIEYVMKLYTPMELDEIR